MVCLVQVWLTQYPNIWDTGLLGPGQSFSSVLEKDSLPSQCSLHPVIGKTKSDNPDLKIQLFLDFSWIIAHISTYIFKNFTLSVLEKNGR